MNEPMIRIQAIVGEKDRQLSAALAEVCNARAETAVRDARLAEAQQKIDALQKQVDDLLGQMADKTLDRTAKNKKGSANDQPRGH